MAGDRDTSGIQIATPRIDNDFNKWLEQGEDFLAYLEHDLRGDALVEEDNRLVWKGIGTPLLNEKGIRYVISSLRHIVNKNTFMSNLNEERVYTLCLFTTQSITAGLFVAWDEFGVKPDYYDLVVEKISNVLELALRRGMDEGERKFLRSVESIHRYFDGGQQQGQQQSGGFFSFLRRR